MKGILETEKIIPGLCELIQKDPGEYDAEMQAYASRYRREHLDVPLISVSAGTAALIEEADKTVEAIEMYLVDRKIKAEVIRTGCLGFCGSEPVVGIQIPGRSRLLFKNIHPQKITLLLDDVFHNSIPQEYFLGQVSIKGQTDWERLVHLSDIPFFKHQQRILLADCGILDPFSIEEYIARGGYKTYLKTIRNYTYQEICEILTESGLRGRSGGGFPTGEKWKMAYSSSAHQKYLICNAEESDPGAFMDRAIMEGNPHLLIEGMCIAAYGIGASKAYIYIRSEYEQSIKLLEHAIRRAYSYGLLGHNVFESGFNLDIILRKGPGAFVCGEETALIKCLEGRRGMPKSKPPYPASSGLFKMPTVINNVETLANVPFIVGKGPKWFRSSGVNGNFGTKIFAISGKAKYTGIIEVPMGINLKKVVLEIAGGARGKTEMKGIQIGGPTGFILPENEMDFEITYEAFFSRGMKMGSGGIILLNDEVCIPDLVKYFMEFMKKESCGKCIPCREGTRRMSEILTKITKKPQEENNPKATLERFKGVMQLENLAEVMKDTSLCGLGKGAPNPVLSTLRYFRQEFEEHIYDRKCSAGICSGLRNYLIDVDICTGCAVCAKKCPVEAIIGTPLHPYFIVQDKCTGCGICFDSCKFSAIRFN